MNLSRKTNPVPTTPLHSPFPCVSRMAITAGPRPNHWLISATAWYNPMNNTSTWRKSHRKHGTSSFRHTVMPSGLLCRLCYDRPLTWVCWEECGPWMQLKDSGRDMKDIRPWQALKTTISRANLVTYIFCKKVIYLKQQNGGKACMFCILRCLSTVALEHELCN